MNALKSKNNISIQKNKLNQPTNAPYFDETIKGETVNDRAIACRKLVTSVKANILLALLPIIKPDKKDVRTLAGHLKVSPATVSNWMTNYLQTDLSKGGELT